LGFDCCLLHNRHRSERFLRYPPLLSIPLVKTGNRGSGAEGDHSRGLLVTEQVIY
jgi:hypothetical protein